MWQHLLGELNGRGESGGVICALRRHCDRLTGRVFTREITAASRRGRASVEVILTDWPSTSWERQQMGVVTLNKLKLFCQFCGESEWDHYLLPEKLPLIQRLLELCSLVSIRIEMITRGVILLWESEISASNWILRCDRSKYLWKITSPFWDKIKSPNDLLYFNLCFWSVFFENDSVYTFNMKLLCAAHSDQCGCGAEILWPGSSLPWPDWWPSHNRLRFSYPEIQCCCEMCHHYTWRS